MPVIQVYHHGCTAGTPPMKNDHQRSLRGDVGGWSESSTRRNTRFLYSVDESQLTGIGMALTLTVKDCPPTSSEWARVRTAWTHRLRRDGLIRMHWVTEWQRRGVPHLHCALWFPDHRGIENALLHWLELTKKAYGTSARGQHLTQITDPMGWFQYVSKHAARGLSHYQRSPENIPPEWRNKTGRMWGKVGDWPTKEPFRFEVDQKGFWQFRRRVRSWRIADARKAVAAAREWKQKRKALRRLKAARTMLQSHDRALCAVRGVSEWIEADQQLLILTWLASQGHQIDH